MKLFAITLKKDVVEDSDSDNDQSKSYQRIRFEYITEVRLNISNQSFSAIQKVSQSKNKANIQQAQPVYFKVFCTGKGNLEEFFIYVSILDQIIVFQRSIADLRPSSLDMIKLLSTRNNSSIHKQDSQISSSGKAFPTTLNEYKNNEGVIDFNKLG